MKFDKRKEYYCSKPRIIIVDGLEVQIKMTEEDYDHAFKMMVLEQKKIVPPDDAVRWIEQNLHGGITKDKLDAQRFKEVNQLDMMMTTSLIYNSQSIIEMQIFIIIHVMWFHNMIDKQHRVYESRGYFIICICLLVHHLFSYVASVFRKWEIEKYGQVDVNGVLRAQKESFLSTIEIFAGCLITGYTINYFVHLK